MTTKEDAVANLLDFKRVMDELKIPFFLMDGTCLGAYRDHDFVCEDEDDIDVGVLEEHYHRVEKAIPKLAKLGIHKYKPFIVKDKLEGFGLKRGDNHVDVMKVHVGEKHAYTIGRCFGRSDLPPIFAYVYPKYCFEGFDTIEFIGLSFCIPNKVEDFLSARYANWRVFVSRRDYDYLSVKQCPCIRKEW